MTTAVPRSARSGTATPLAEQPASARTLHYSDLNLGELAEIEHDFDRVGERQLARTVSFPHLRHQSRVLAPRSGDGRGKRGGGYGR